MPKVPTLANLSRRTWRLVWLGGGLLVIAGAAIAFWPWVSASQQLSAARRALRLGDVAAALEALDAARAIQPDRAEVQYLLAVASRRAGRPGQVEPHLRRAAELGWPEEDLRRQAWLATAQSGNVKGVERYLMEAIERGVSDDDAEEIYEAVAKGHLAAYRLRDAWKCVDVWLQWRSDAPVARKLRAYIYERLEQWPRAIEDYRVALESLPEDREARVKLAQALLLANQFDEARQEFETCLAADPGDPEALLGLAQCERRLGADDEVRRHVQAALARTLTPLQRANALAELGRLALGEGKAQEAVDLLQEAAGLAPAESAIRLSLATALTRAGQPEQAKQHHDRVRQIRAQYDRIAKITKRLIDTPEDAQLRYEAGSILIEQGFTAEGVAWLRTALQCDPNHRQTRELLGRYDAPSGGREPSAGHLPPPARGPESGSTPRAKR